jgi:hypothetical protein
LRRPPRSLYLLTAAALLLGGWMTADGLFGRLFGTFLPLLGGPGWWQLLPRALGVEPLVLAWPLIVVGTVWLGALTGLWSGLGWSYRAALCLGIVSLLYLGPGTALGLISLGCLWGGRLRRWLPATQE